MLTLQHSVISPPTAVDTRAQPCDVAAHHTDAQEPRPSVEQLLIRVAGHDIAAFDQLYTLTARRVFGLIRRTLADAELSEETTQDVFLGLWQSGAARFDPTRGSGLSWILTLAHRRAVDKVRAEESHRKRTLKWCTKNQDVDHDSVADGLIRSSETTAIRAGLGALSDVQREAIHLAYYMGLTYVQVAERLGIPVPTAKTRIRDGILRLRRTLAEEN